MTRGSAKGLPVVRWVPLGGDVTVGRWRMTGP